MANDRQVAITGAFSYTGKYLARILLERGYEIRTLTNHPDASSPLAAKIRAIPYRFDTPEKLAESLAGCEALINTYWVRFPRGRMTFERAVENSRTLIRAAKSAGVQRIVHVSIANPSHDSPLGYYRGKAQVEDAMRESGLSFAILRPTVIFGREDILINNIAWFVRHFPVFAVPGNGRYRVQPIFVQDMAALLASGVERADNYVLDAVGPETFTFGELVKLTASNIGRRTRIVHLPAPLAYAATKTTGWLLGDVVLTWQEYRGLIDNLLVSQNPPTGTTRLSEWLAENRDTVGLHYASEVARHF